MSNTELEQIIVVINGFRGDSPSLDKLHFHAVLDTPSDSTLGAKVNAALHFRACDFVTISKERKP